jgi:hypothetical protein
VTQHGLSPAVPCLFPGCNETVRFELGSANGDGRTPRAHARCPNGHPHYAEDYVRYGTERESGSPGASLAVRASEMAEALTTDAAVDADRHRERW